MSGQRPELASRREGVLQEDPPLWKSAPAWRLLLIGAIGLSIALVSIPLAPTSSIGGSVSVTPPLASDQAPSAPPNTQCDANPGPFLGPFGNRPVEGVVVGFLTPEAAMRLLQTTQEKTRMAINPNYISNPRALVHVDGTPEGNRVVALVDKGLTVMSGNHVEFVGGHPDPNMPCHYVPNLIGRIL